MFQRPRGRRLLERVFSFNSLQGTVKVRTRHLLKRSRRGLNVDFPEDVCVSFFSNFFVSHTNQSTGPISDDGSGILSFWSSPRNLGILAVRGTTAGDRSYLFPSPTSSSTRTDSKRLGARDGKKFKSASEMTGLVEPPSPRL